MSNKRTVEQIRIELEEARSAQRDCAEKLKSVKLTNSSLLRKVNLLRYELEDCLLHKLPIKD